MSTSTRAPARRDEMTAEWFDGLRAGRLLDVCGATDLGWAEASGHGSVLALAADHSTRPVTRLVIVELAEGPWLITRLEGTLVQRGEDVVVRYVGDGEGEAYPVVTAVHRNDT